ncbi:Rv1733c family protein [Streptomyces tagetis]|uniref:Integral membrane protein n=1 Tax=Streptomyces tagetis TaxID=2820809 RepID=A0A941B022_9ACTN|nr:hypothetical protein [Streptomyces sp. RG38]MBQ0826825.1 hypothetical protein [Streptomyces sp. RG38]
MRTRVRGWRWRRNPLRRRSDVVEAWTVLIVALLLFIGVPLVGVYAAARAHDQAEQVAAVQRAQRHRVTATVVRTDPSSLPSEQTDGHASRATVRWHAPDGGTRTAGTEVPSGTRQGDVIGLWLDGKGRTVAPPTDDTAVWQHTVTVGTCTTLGAGLTVLLMHGGAYRLLQRHRLTGWEREWERTEPRWSHRRA